jgi:hypothetical protein
MVSAVHALLRAGWRFRLIAALSLLLTVGGIGAAPALAGTPFQRGDVFLSGSSGIQEFTPTGQLVQTAAGTSGATTLCFDPSGRHVILPGVGLFNASGNRLPSNWASLTSDINSLCVADGLGHVYVSDPRPDATHATFSKYDLRGDHLATFTVTPVFGLRPLALDLAPDECTMYYGNWNGGHGTYGQFNVCTNTPVASVIPSFAIDDLRVLPDWRVIATDDPSAFLVDASGQFVQSYKPAPLKTADLRFVSLDPDGTSFWLSTIDGSRSVFRFDVNSGQQLAAWTGGGPMAVYGPPLVGNADVAPTVDSNPDGTAEAFARRAQFSGQLTYLRLYLDSSSTASQAIVGVYSDRGGHPRTLLTQATITNIRTGSWNNVHVPPITVTAGQRYWLAVLAPSGAGTISFRDTAGRGRSQTSAGHGLTGLPTRWSGGRTRAIGQLSAYGG